MGTNDNRGIDRDSEDIAVLRATRDKLKWAAPKARYHLVRLGKWHKGRGDPTPDQLSGAGTLVKIGHRKGILTAAHNIRAKFPGSASYWGQTMEAIIGKSGRPTISIDVELRHAVVEGGTYSKGEPEQMGPDIAWIPLHPEKVGLFEQHGKVFFDWRDGRFPATADGDSRTDRSRSIAVGHLVTGFSGVREDAVSQPSGPPRMLEVAQDAFFPEREWEGDGWDYQERVLDSTADGDDVEVHFDEDVSMADRAAIKVRVDDVGGLSGGAVWRFGRDEKGCYFDLAGIVWYQRNRDESGVLRIVNHGRNSIRRVIAPASRT